MTDTATKLCGSRHAFGDSTCVRTQGHDGKCWGKWERMRRAVWWFNDDGEFRHDGYEDLRR